MKKVDMYSCSNEKCGKAAFKKKKKQNCTENRKHRMAIDAVAMTDHHSLVREKHAEEVNKPK